MVESSSAGCTSKALLLENVTVVYKTGILGGYVKALENITLELGYGDSLCIVGESGCGKTTLCRVAVGLQKPSSGRVYVCGEQIYKSRVRAPVAYIPQHPESSLDPRWRIIDSIAEPMRLDGDVDYNEVLRIAQLVGLRGESLYRYPSQVSGGEVQRAVIARALIKKPKLLVADEPTSMLDPSTQALVINSILNLKARLGFSLLMATHDIELASRVCRWIAVMYRGLILEYGLTREVLENPLHPYTRWLLGLTESLRVDLNSKCPFTPSCSRASGVCYRLKPSLKRMMGNHYVACHNI